MVGLPLPLRLHGSCPASWLVSGFVARLPLPLHTMIFLTEPDLFLLNLRGGECEGGGGGKGEEGERGGGGGGDGE